MGGFVSASEYCIWVKKCSQKQEIDHDYLFAGGGSAGCGERAPGASFVITAFAFLRRDQHVFLMPVFNSW